MPELPEVETIVRELRVKVRNKTITGFTCNVPKMLNYSSADFSQKIFHQKIKAVSRRAKMIIISLSGQELLLIHLKMTGQLIYQDKRGRKVGGGHPIKIKNLELPNKFTHAVVSFTDRSQLYFNDIRKFGWLKILSPKELENFGQEFGLEPLAKDFSFDRFNQLLQLKKPWPIKKFLLDQSLIAGLGNIYADESCFLAGIKPTRKIKSLTKAEKQSLHRAIKRILLLAISRKGTSVDTYIQLNGLPGGFVPYLKVYDREGERCRRCQRGVIKKIKFVGRGTHFCPQCQR